MWQLQATQYKADSGGVVLSLVGMSMFLGGGGCWLRVLNRVRNSGKMTKTSTMGFKI